MATKNQTSPNRLQFMLRALRHRNYRLFFGGQIVSLSGSWMTQVAMVWLVYRLTGSAWDARFGRCSPAKSRRFCWGPVAGVMVDRWPRQRLLVTTQAAAMTQSGLLAILTLTGVIEVWHIVALSILQGLINAFDIPARQAFVVEIVESKDDLSNAIALNSSLFNVARLVGPAIGGVLISLVGEGWCFAIDSASYIAVISSLLMMRVAARVSESRRGQGLQELREAWAYVVASKPISAILILLACMSLFGMPYSVLTPIIVTKSLGGGSNTLGFLGRRVGLRRAVRRPRPRGAPQHSRIGAQHSVLYHRFWRGDSSASLCPPICGFRWRFCGSWALPECKTSLRATRSCRRLSRTTNAAA